MRVSIVGAGYVGLVSAVGLAEVGHDVLCVDRDKSKIDLINEGKSPIYEKGLAELLATNIGKRLRAITSIAEAVNQTDLTIIAVDTPFDGERIVLRSIEDVAREIGQALAEKDSYHTVVVKSTVVPGTTDSFVLPILEEASGKLAGEDFGLGMNPEFLREGQAIADFLNPDRIVLGGIDRRSHDVMSDLYEPFAGAEVLRTTTRTAEMVKYTANSLLATLISFSNEIANLAARVGVDAMEVMRGVHLDKRFTPIDGDGSRVWPGAISYLEPGCGFGGSCFPKDVKSLIAFGEEHDSPMRILQSVMDVNEAQPAKMLDLLSRHFSRPGRCGGHRAWHGIQAGNRRHSRVAFPRGDRTTSGQGRRGHGLRSSSASWRGQGVRGSGHTWRRSRERRRGGPGDFAHDSLERL